MMRAETLMLLLMLPVCILATADHNARQTDNQHLRNACRRRAAVPQRPRRLPRAVGQPRPRPRRLPRAAGLHTTALTSVTAMRPVPVGARATMVTRQIQAGATVKPHARPKVAQLQLVAPVVGQQRLPRAVGQPRPQQLPRVPVPT